MAGGWDQIPKENKKAKQTNSGILKLSDIHIVASSQRENLQTSSTCLFPITEREVCFLNFLP